MVERVITSIKNLNRIISAFTKHMKIMARPHQCAGVFRKTMVKL